MGHEQWVHYHFWQLALLYEKSSCLWKKDARHYLDSERRYRAYKKIRRAMKLPGLSLIEVVLRLREMRRLYVDELKKLLEAEASGYCHETSFPWFYDLHRFLYPYLDYDESLELHNAGPTADPWETDDHDPPPDPANCYHSDCPMTRDTVCDCDGQSSRAPGAMNSISSPAVSTPEVKARFGTCPLSCGRIARERNRLERLPSDSTCPAVRGSSEKPEHHGVVPARDASPGTGQVDRKPSMSVVSLQGRRETRGSPDTVPSSCESDSDESFAAIVSRCLRKLRRPFATRARMEILDVLRNFMAESKTVSCPRSK
ncbi:uncharacterized protein LOC143175184 [Nomia melanderi]|uniref:uncharacterized protein LOC143175184 n=1 Tax=Nomia melanderi TaxID=2448451 RepID=UPI003FCCB8A6